MDDQYEMLYCDDSRCRVNTFERGDGSDRRDGRNGLCPACYSEGIPVR